MSQIMGGNASIIIFAPETPDLLTLDGSRALVRI